MVYGGYGGKRLATPMGVPQQYGRRPVTMASPPAVPGGGHGFNSGDPFARGAASGTSALLREGGQYGFFDPGGSQRFRMGQRRRILGMGRNRRNRAALLARLSGMDRMGTQNALQESERDQADFQSDALNDFDVNDYGQNRDYFRGLLGSERGYEEERRRAEEERKAQDGGFWGGLGSLAGEAGLAYLTGGTSLLRKRG